MRSRREAGEALRRDPGLPHFLKAIAKAKSSLERRGLYLPEIQDIDGIDGLTRLVFLSTPAIDPREARPIRDAAAGLLSRAFGLDPASAGLLYGQGPWDCHICTTSGFFMPEMRSAGLFDRMHENGGTALFLAGGIGQEALEFLGTLGLEPGNRRVRSLILEKDPRYALASMMRGFELLLGRPASVEEHWGMKCPPMDMIFLSFPTADMDFRHAAVQMDAALKIGGMAVLLGNLDFAGEATDYFLERCTRLANPFFRGAPIEHEFLQIYLKG